VDYIFFLKEIRRLGRVVDWNLRSPEIAVCKNQEEGGFANGKLEGRKKKDTF